MIYAVLFVGFCVLLTVNVPWVSFKEPRHTLAVNQAITILLLFASAILIGLAISEATK